MNDRIRTTVPLDSNPLRSIYLSKLAEAIAVSSTAMTPTMRLSYVARALNDIRSSVEYPARTDPKCTDGGWAFRDEVDVTYMRCLQTAPPATEREIFNRLARLLSLCTNTMVSFAPPIDAAIGILELPVHGWVLPPRWGTPGADGSKSGR